MESLRRRYSEEVATEAKEVLEKAAERLNEIAKKLKD